jgi:hypothetical protein
VARSLLHITMDGVGGQKHNIGTSIAPNNLQTVKEHEV